MTQMHARLVLLLLAACAPRAYGSLLPSEVVTLSRSDATELSTQACGMSHGVATSFIVARRLTPARPGYPPVFAQFRCQPHQVLDGHPIRRIGNCENKKGRWRCHGRDYTEIAVDDSTVSVTPEAPVTFQAAIQIVKDVVKFRWLRDTDVAEPLRGATCVLSESSTELWRLDCGFVLMDIGHLCAQNPCVYTPTVFMYGQVP
jgi:hypothetical protein